MSTTKKDLKPLEAVPIPPNAPMEVVEEETGQDPVTGRFVPGNQLWKRVDPKKVGRRRKFASPRKLWDEAVKYFEHCDESSFYTNETYIGSNNSYVKKVKHFSPYTWQGLFVFCNICDLEAYKKRPEFSSVLSMIDHVIREQKFAGATAGVFNANIIARDLGLTDKTDITTNGETLNNDNIDYSKLSDSALKAIVQARTESQPQ